MRCEDEVDAGGGWHVKDAWMWWGIDPEMMIQLLSTKNHDLEEKLLITSIVILTLNKNQSEIGKMLNNEGEDS
jgi:hypothetical protein